MMHPKIDQKTARFGDQFLKATGVKMTSIEFMDNFENIPLTLKEQIKQSAGRATEAQRRKSWEQALASARIEGFKPSAEYLADVERNIIGELSDNDFEKKYLGKAEKKGQVKLA